MPLYRVGTQKCYSCHTVNRFQLNIEPIAVLRHLPIA